MYRSFPCFLFSTGPEGAEGYKAGDDERNRVLNEEPKIHPGCIEDFDVNRGQRLVYTTEDTAADNGDPDGEANETKDAGKK